ncbi:ABC transporter ATP-binding protein YojI [compost metagenome]
MLVFDEWAADQDPTFRRIFYTELLPDLKRLGKTIIVISHDDRYFDIADQLVRMEAGRVVTQHVPA